MSKRRGQETENQRRSGKRLQCRKHLYLVLDDWDKGFTIHKIDADSFDSDYHDDTEPASDGVAVAGHLTEPPAIRLQEPGEDACMFFTALDNKIFIVTDQCHGQTPALMYDTETTGLAFGPRVPAHLQCGFNVVVAAGEALYAFSSPRYNKQKSFQVMSWKPTALDHYNPRYPSEGALPWRSLSGPPPPFDRYEIITSYAAHPEGHTIFMTTSYSDRPNVQKSSYSFNTKNCAWKWHAWVLPFKGPGYFDCDLDAWVGLHKDEYICSCRVATDSGSATPINLGLVQLDYKILKNKLFLKDRERHVRASLTYMGRSKFCLVETVIHKVGVNDEDFHLSAHDGCVLHMTIFVLKRGRPEMSSTSHAVSTGAG
ncbi:hypothetical protein QOZ80_1BG0087190 [Eleusine coracana subsp. coracana]|nr:hypothetical protein QOZ80_1BG0087190 [Eleusine coracana subsp. coracana]